MAEGNKTLANLPLDMISEVLCRLPTKILLRFTSVCKSWNLLIKSKEFATKILNRNCSKLDAHYHLLLDGDWVTMVNGQTLEEHPRYQLPFKNSGCFIKSCRGLALVELKTPITGSGQVFLWNPSVRKVKFIDSYVDDSNDHVWALFCYALGYDDVQQDYKVLKWEIYLDLNTFRRADRPDELRVYSLRADSWHRIHDEIVGDLIPFSWSRKIPFVDGASHWLASASNYPGTYTIETILSFDFKTEAFRKMLLPLNLKYPESSFVWLEEFGGSLALDVSKTVLDRGTAFFGCDLWEMRRYGVEKSWIKHSFALPCWKYKVTKNGIIWGVKQDQEQDCMVLFGYENRQVKASKEIPAGLIEGIFLQDGVDFMDSIALLEGNS